MNGFEVEDGLQFCRFLEENGFEKRGLWIYPTEVPEDYPNFVGPFPCAILIDGNLEFIHENSHILRKYHEKIRSFKKTKYF